MKKALIGVALGGLLLAGCNSGDTGYMNIPTLEQSIQSTTDAKLAKEGSATTITAVVCVAGSADRTFMCNVTASDNSSATVTATVAPDGDSWVTNNG